MNPIATTSTARIASPANALEREFLREVFLRFFGERLFFRVGFRLAI
jgi:hypothetical protein